MAQYLDKVAVHAALVEFLTAREAALAEGKEKPQIPNSIGDAIYLVCSNLAHRPNFSNYSYIDDMIDNGIELCIRYVHKYDFRKYNNPHTFFTQYAWRGFVDVINLEEKHSYIKAKLAVSPEEMSVALQEIDKDSRPSIEDVTIPFFDIEAYEAKNFSNTKPVTDEPLLVGLEEYIEELIKEDPTTTFIIEGIAK